MIGLGVSVLESAVGLQLKFSIVRTKCPVKLIVT